MKIHHVRNELAALWFLAALPASGESFGDAGLEGQTVDAVAPEIERLVTETGRFPLLDLDGDRWDELWLSLFGRKHGGEDLTHRLKSDPHGDPDGDGIINYIEMLDFTDPWKKEVPYIPLTADEAKQQKVTRIKAERLNDAKIMSRFQTLLEQRGVLHRAYIGTQKPEQETAPEGDERGSSSYVPDQTEHDWPTMLCSTIGSPSVLFAERLSSGQFLLAWEGEDDRLYDIEWSDDLLKWNWGASQMPVVGGVGNWGQFSSAKKRFYRVVDSGVTTIPSDPNGGGGGAIGGAILVMDMEDDGSPTTTVYVTTNLPSGVTASAVDLHVDGEMDARCVPSGSDNVFIGLIKNWEFTEGSHHVEAIVHADSETTAVLEQAPRGTIRSAATAFSLIASQESGIGFRVSDTQIAPNDPDLPTSTLIAVDIPFDPQGAGWINIRNETGVTVKRWEWGLEDYPLQFREEWDGTDEAGSQVQGGSYSVHLSYGGSGFDQGFHMIAAGQRTWEALCLTETMGGWRPGSSIDTFRPPWAPYYTSSGGLYIEEAWGPWKYLISPPRIADEVRGRLKEVFGLGKTGKWKVRFWQSESRNNDSIPDPVVAFASGGNPFNNYDLGIFIGHGVACAGGTKTLLDGTTITRPPQSYYPLVKSRTTGESHWVESAGIPKYGAAGKLKWMFLMTCNSLTAIGEHAIYNPCKANGTLPFGNGLRVLCGYTTKIQIEGGMGGWLSDALVNKIPNEEFREGTVVNAWGYVWKESSNKAIGKVARAVYWPECQFDTIYGVDHLNIPALQQHASQMELEERDFTP